MGELNLDELERLAADDRAAFTAGHVRALIARIRDLEAQSGDRLVELAEQAARIRELEQDAEALARVLRENDELRAKVRELEQGTARYQHVRAHGMPRQCPGGFYYGDGVLHPTAEGAIDAARKEKGHG